MKQSCFGCEHLKIWYDEENYTMRLSCTNTSKKGKTITWKSFPLYEMKNGDMQRTSDSIESITEEFKDYAKRRMSPKWCPFRKHESGD